MLSFMRFVLILSVVRKRLFFIMNFSFKIINFKYFSIKKLINGMFFLNIICFKKQKIAFS
jgi:hypothetical protein